MKTFVLASAAAHLATASMDIAYVIDIDTEVTNRKFLKDPITGAFRCEPGFTGSDCSQRKCPYALSFTTGQTTPEGKFADWLYTPSYSRTTYSMAAATETSGQASTQKDATFDGMHVYKECGGRGQCDRTTGICKCFASFEGEGCRRTTCPNDCSGHGVCLTDANSLYYVAGEEGQTPLSPYSGETADYAKADGAETWSNHWTYLKYQQCHCDRGFEGDDCSLRQCPKGDDPETVCDTDLANDAQQVSCQWSQAAVDAQASDPNAGAFFSMSFTDQFGGTYSTRPIYIKVDDADPTGDAAKATAKWNAESIQDALEALPNFAIPQVEVDYINRNNNNDAGFEVKFTDGHNTGQQHMLTVSTQSKCDCLGDDCKDPDGTSAYAGSQPRFESLHGTAGGDLLSCTVTRIARQQGTNYRESATCSNRGRCDTSTGKCNCFDGYFGNACDNVNTYI